MKSYAQHGEDLKIAELLEWDGVRPLWWIDIGAWHASSDSVTKAFYDAGGCGINIEPQPPYYATLVAERPRDVNLPIAISDTGGGELHPFTVIHGSGLSTFHPRFAAQWASNSAHETIQIPVYTLKEMCDTHVPRVSGLLEIGEPIPRQGIDALSEPHVPIDFMKIDVEGWELHVIRGADWETYRPKILCIEATEPGTMIPYWGEWEPLLFAAGYEFVEMAAVNRYYRDARA